MAEELMQLTEEQKKVFEEKIKNMSPDELVEFQKKQCIFCQIIAGKVPSKKIYEDDQVFAVLDIAPATRGHILILPKEHYAIMPQITDKELSHLFLVGKNLSQILLRVLKVKGTNLFIANGLAAGQRAQHFMIHLIPRKEGDGLLQIEEKLINQEMLQQVKVAVENKLNETLGLKKEIFSVDDSIEEEDEIPIKIEDIPKVVLKSLQKELPGAEIKEAELEVEEGKMVYELTVLQEGKLFEVEITPKGKVVKIEEEKPVRKMEYKEELIKKKGNKVKSKKKSAKKTTTKKSVKKEKEEGVSLDDIASLFK